MPSIKIPKKTLVRWKANYEIIGVHSGIQICTWTKKALRGKGGCYKQKFYGIDTHRCAQISPAFAWCQQNCIFCWRSCEWMKSIKMNEKDVDEPNKIIAGICEKRKKLISGIKGAYDADVKKWKESFEFFPSHWAISLSGEPTLYPKLGEFVKELRKHKEVRSIFIVSNGQEPKALAKLAKENALPTQLYISVSASDAKMYEKINQPKYKNGWKRLNKTIGLLPKLNCRRVIRHTLIKGVNDAEKDIKNFACMFEKAEPDFIEIKAYMFLGDSRKRLIYENMPVHTHVKNYAEKIAIFLPNYFIQDEDKLSRIVLFKRKDTVYENYIERV